MRLLIALLSVGMALSAHAETVTVRWVNPTQYVDDSSLSVADISSTTVVWSATQTGLASSTQRKVVTGFVTSTTVELPAGTWFIAAMTTTRGLLSALSNVITVTVAQPAPKPPSAVSATIAAVVVPPVIIPRVRFDGRLRLNGGFGQGV